MNDFYILNIIILFIKKIHLFVIKMLHIFIRYQNAPYMNKKIKSFSSNTLDNNFNFVKYEIYSDIDILSN